MYRKLEYISKNKNPVILCVNSNDSSFELLKKELDFNPLYSIVLAKDDEEALEITHITKELHLDIAIMVVDYDVKSENNIKGDELLIKLHSIMPSSKKILVVDSKNYQAINNTINNANLYQYISKPIEVFDVKLTILNAIKSYEDELLIKQNEMLLEAKVKERTKELQESNQRLYLLAATDPLTGINNRRSFFEFAIKEYATAIRYQDTLSVGIIDIDDFGQINDKFGHQAGDKVLKEVAKRVNKILRLSDTLGRIGGDEFAFILSHTSIDGAKTASLKILQAVKNTPFIIDNNINVDITISIGISEFLQECDDKIKDILKRAENALKKAKENGKDQIQIELEDCQTQR